MQGGSLIRLQGLAKKYEMGEGVVRALDGVDLRIHKGEYVAFIGASGSGKTTLMNIIGCLDRPSSGAYELKGRDVAGMSDGDLAMVRNREIGFVFQNFNLLPRADALRNVMQPLMYRPIESRRRREMAREMLSRVGLADRADHLPAQLSGGQRQRIAIARALVGEPSILLADEPTGNLDSGTTEEMMQLFDDLNASGQTVVMVTHEMDIAARCRRRVRLRDGKVVSDEHA
jgi:putative ABC transport system ATP-binding protein